MGVINPYIPEAPATENNFYGREKLVNIIRDTLAGSAANLLVLFGPRRIGKSSLLQNLEHQATLKDFIFVYNDTTKLSHKPAHETLYHLGRKIAQALDLPAPSETQLQYDEQAFQSEFLVQVYEKLTHRRLVLLLDEFGIFEDKPKANPQVDVTGQKSALSVLENLINTEPKLAFIVSLDRGKEKLSADLSRLTRTGQWLKTPLLEEEEARRLITEPARDQLTYLPEAEKAILALTAGHPYYTQLLCHEIFTRLQAENSNQVAAPAVQKAAEKLLESGADRFGWLWETLPPAERVVASLLAEAAEGSPDHLVTETQLSAASEKNHIHRRGLELSEAPGQLVDLELIERREPASYRYVVELVRRWVYANHPASQEREKNLLLLSQKAAQEFSAAQTAADPNLAALHYQEALAANPNHISAQLALAEILLHRGQINEAVEFYEAASWLDEAKAKAGLDRARIVHRLTHQGTTRANLLRPAWIVGLVVVVSIAAVFLVWIGLFSQNEAASPANQEIVSLDVSTPLPENTLEPTQEPQPQLTSEPISTPTQPPTQVSTTEPTIEPTTGPVQEIPTAEPTTAPTEQPTQTPTVEPTTEPTSEPTEEIFTPEPTTEPTEQPTQEPPSEPTPGASSPFIYNAPTLINPAPETSFTPNEEIVLQWADVGALAENEQYAIRVRFMENGVLKIEGDQVKSPSWLVPPSFFNRADGPERKYEWFVFVEKRAEAGPNPQISPDSEIRVFYWR